jgi:hypothetical protein
MASKIAVKQISQAQNPSHFRIKMIDDQKRIELILQLKLNS